MGKREKVLIALMVAAISYGAFELFFRPALKAPAVKPEDKVNVEEVVQLSTTIAKSMQESQLGDTEDYLVQAAASQWASNPFYVWPQAIIPEEALLEERLESIIYSGYLEMGRSRIAVINGLEYQAGEMLPDGQFVVEGIAPASVTLRSTTSDQQEITIPYKDAFIQE